MDTPASRGRFITFEGPEGSGKSTQIERLRWRLAQAGRVVVTTREPGGTALGRQLRQLVLSLDGPAPAAVTQALLLSSDRAQHVHEVIRPALSAGTTVISDRYVDSTLAYQGFGEGLDLATLQAVCQFATGGLLPDLTILLDVDVRVGIDRRLAAHRSGSGEFNRMDGRDLSFHQRVRDGFRALALREPERFVVVDGHAAPDTVAVQIWERVAALLGVRAEPDLARRAANFPLPTLRHR